MRRLIIPSLMTTDCPKDSLAWPCRHGRRPTCVGFSTVHPAHPGVARMLQAHIDGNNPSEREKTAGET